MTARQDMVREVPDTRLQTREDGQRIRNRGNGAAFTVLPCGGGHVWRGQTRVRV